jgi:hypothetical protein
MTQDRFLKYLDNPTLLATISYEELKTLTLAYPFAHNLRYLLAIKAKQDYHPEYAKNLALASTYSLDRKRLFQILAPPQLAPQRISVKEEEKIAVLELKPIETVQKELKSRTSQAIQIQDLVPPAASPQKAFSIETPPQTITFTEKTTPKNLESVQMNEVVIPPISKKIMEESAVITTEAIVSVEIPIATTTFLAEKLVKEEAKVEMPQTSFIPAAAKVEAKPLKPLVFEPKEIPKTASTSFNIWRSQFSLPVLGGQSEENDELYETSSSKYTIPQHPLPENLKVQTHQSAPNFKAANLQPAQPKSEARLLAERSLSENKDLVSETLAKLYVRQGHFEKALIMYQRLSLAIPEKSHYFAAEIDKLKK